MSRKIAKIPKEEVDAVISQYMQGYTVREVMRSCGLTYYATWKILNLSGVKMHDRYEPQRTINRELTKSIGAEKKANWIFMIE